MWLGDSHRQAPHWAASWLHRLLPILLPLLVFGIAALILDSTTQSGFRLALEVVPLEHGPTTQQIVRATEIRFAWATAQLVLGTAMMVTIVMAFVMSVRTLGSVISLAAGFISSIIGGAFFVAREEHGLVIMPFASELFYELELAGQHWFGGGISSWIETATITEALSIPLIILVGMAYSGLLWPARREEPTGPIPTLTLDDLRERRQMAAMLLYCSAVVLVSFLVEFYTILRWPAVVVANFEPVLAMATGVTAWAGVFFTLILATMVIPVIISLSRQAGEYAVANRHTTPSEVKTWLRTEGFGFSGWRRTTEIFAVVAPSFVGLAGLPIVEALMSVLAGG